MTARVHPSLKPDTARAMCGQCYGGDLDCDHCEGSGYEPALPVHRPDLLQALIEARAALHQHYVDWDGEPEDAVPLQLARAKCDAAIAKALGK